MDKKLKILYVAAELSEYASAGGLGEVGRGFPRALLGAEEATVYRVMPLYKQIDQKLSYVTDYPVAMEKGYETCILKKDAKEKDIPTYFIDHARYFYREQIYAYEDDSFRFFFFCKAVVEMLKHLHFVPDIVHCNDWHTGFLVLLLKKEFPKIKTVFTIHNISYHGFVPASYLSSYLTTKEEQLLGWPEWLNAMKAGIIYSDLLTTVSPGYSKEIMTSELGCGLAPLIQARSNKLIGILNGVDTKSYDPRLEGIHTVSYDEKHLELKHQNRTRLRNEYKLPDLDIPLVVMITRLDYAKGIDVVMKAISYIDFTKVQLLILGSGNAYYEEMLTSIAAGYPQGIAVEFHYTQTLARQIYAAADIYLMPSQFEPCGLGQLYAMRYGVVPIVNPVGGLKDTVREDMIHPEKSTGFYMEEWSAEALYQTLERAVEAYHSPVWSQYQLNCMRYDSSWNKSARAYLKQYHELMGTQKAKK